MSKYTAESILADAARFTIKRDWRKQSYPFYKAAQKLGAAFYASCQAHMEKRVKTGTSGMKGKFKYTGAEIEAAAKLYQHRNQWKRGPHGRLYSAGRNRYGANSERWKALTAHMRPPINPFREACYLVYVCEFEDRHAYVGITCDKDTRWGNHLRRGPVFRHHQRQPGVPYQFREVQTGITREEAQTREQFWKDTYLDNEWTPLWSVVTPDGSLGSVPSITKAQCAACAALCTTRGEFLRRYQSRYKIAKKRGWYEEITSHMPTDLEARQAQARKNAAKPVTEATRARQRASALARAHSAPPPEPSSGGWSERVQTVQIFQLHA